MQPTDNQGTDREGLTPEQLIEQSDENAKKVYQEIQDLRSSVNSLRTGEPQTTRNTASFDAAYREQMKKQLEDVEKRREEELQESIREDAEKTRKEIQKELRAARRAEKKRQKAERDEARRKEREEREEARRRERAEREEARRREREERSKKAQREKEIRDEVKRKKRLANRTAQMGGGVVKLHDTQISTELQPVGRYSIGDLLGIVPREKKKHVYTQAEMRELQQEQEAIREEARQAASHLSRVRANRYHNSAMGRRVDSVKGFAERHKAILLILLSLVLLIAVGTAGVFNYYTLYEYSYNGHSLGYVKNKDDVLRITDMVQRALTEDKDIEVVIDAKDDITFRRVSTLDKDIQPDSSDQVLKRLTYMGDLNVKAWGIYVNGKKIGAVQKKTVAADVLKKIEDKYASDKKGTTIEKAEILEDVEVKKSNTDLRNVSSSDEIVDILCTSGWKETVHTVVAGETLSDIAETYGTTEESIQRDNPIINPKKLDVGTSLLIRQNAPILTVRITERRTYNKTIKFETEEQKTDEMYEGERQITQEGENGKEEITERTVSINGEVDKDSVTILDRKVKKEAVKKVIVIGTAERPPSVGDGVYIWPLAGGYTLTSRFGSRWGRHHDGIDLGTPVGNDVMAADGGIVTRAGYFGGYGYCVDIDHQNGESTRYGHLSQILVSPGDEVYEGMHIAESGNTGRSTGAHLHFEIHINGTPVDPLGYLP